MFKKKSSHHDRGLTDVDESVLLLTKPYAVITLVCWILSLFCIVNTMHDRQSSSFVIAAITFIIDNVFLVILFIRAKRIRRKYKEGNDE